MRLWSLHPKYLDAKGLVALWREALLAKAVLEGKTKGYGNHPQLHRFRETGRGIKALNFYLRGVWTEAENRGYEFDKEKIDRDHGPVEITVTRGQVDYEFSHLLNKLRSRDPERYNSIKDADHVDVHPMFRIIKGDVEPWEKTYP